MSLVLAAVAAGLAYAVATLALGEVEAVFAPIAALITVGMGGGQRLRRALEIAAGVAVGLLAAYAFGLVVGAGPLQLALAVLVSMGVAAMVNGSTLLANQAAVAAVVAIVLTGILPGGPLLRLADALIGGAVAIVLSAVFSPSPTRPARRAASAVVASVADAVRGCRTALDDAQLDLVEEMARDIDRAVAASGDLSVELEAARERRKLGRDRRRGRRDLEAVAHVSDRLPVLLATIRGLERGARNALRHGAVVDPRMLRSLDSLGSAFDRLAAHLNGSDRDPVVVAALAAVVEVAAAGDSWEVVVLRGHIRSLVIDVLRCCGFAHDEAMGLLDSAMPGR